MKRNILALLLALCLLAPCFAFGEAAESEAEAQLTLHDVRYYFEHRLMRDLFYEDPDQFLGFIVESGVFALWTNFTTQLPYDITYQETDFGQDIVAQTENSVIIRCCLPMPEDSPLCKRVYFFWNLETDQKAYYTIEYDNFMGEAWFLCGWTEDGTHMDWGMIDTTADPDETGLEQELAAVQALIEESLQPAE